MSKQAEVQQIIEQIINDSRFDIEGLGIDSKTAARNILEYLENENILFGDDVKVF